MTDKTHPHYLLSTSLAKQMKCGIFTNRKGEVLVVHDQEIEDPIQWVDYNRNDNQISIVHENGIAQDLGLEISEKMKGNLAHGIEVTFSYIKNEEVKSTQKVTLLIQDYEG